MCELKGVLINKCTTKFLEAHLLRRMEFVHGGSGNDFREEENRRLKKLNAMLRTSKKGIARMKRTAQSATSQSN